EDAGQRARLVLPRDEERHVPRRVKERKRERPAPRRRLRRVVDVQDEPLFFFERGMPGEERGRVTVRTHAEEHEIETGDSLRGGGREDRKRTSDVGLIALRGIPLGDRDAVNVPGRNRNVAEK